MAGAAEVYPLFLLLGGSLAAGWLGHELFRRYRVSDILFLLLVGLVAGPLLGLADAAFFRPAAAVLAPLALAIVLFEAGLDLRLQDVGRAWARSLLLTLLAWSLGAASIALVVHLAFGFAPIIAALFGIAVSATGILGVVPLLQRMRVPADARVMLTIETSIGDLLSAVATTALASWLILDVPAYTGLVLFGAKLVVGGAVGLLVGIGWARGLHALGADDRYAFALTLATILVAYVATEALHGSGYFMALAFGLVVGNAAWFMRAGGLRALAPPPERARLHTSEAIFVLRSVFFVFLGLSVPREALTPKLLLVGVALTVAMVGARVAAVWLTQRIAGLPRDPGTRTLLVAMMPRGLATAVIAGIPVAMGVPGTEAFITLVFVVIVAADIAATVGIHAYERARIKGTSSVAAPSEPAAPHAH